MQLHQLLRYVNLGTPIVIFDIAGIQIEKVYSKENINIDLYEYDILEIGTGKTNNTSDRSCLYITIQK